MIKYVVKICVLLLFWNQSLGQTNISGGPVSGIWTKNKSPYKINGQIYIPKDSLLIIESGVKVEFQGAYMLNVYGGLSAIGAVNDTVVFTATNTSTGWQGMHFHGSVLRADSVIFDRCKIQYVNYSNLTLYSHGAIYLDSVQKFALRNSVLLNNSSNVGGCIRASRSRLNISNCTFLDNTALDLGSSATSATGSAIHAIYSNVYFQNCVFNNNKCYLPNNSSDSIKALSGPTVYLTLCDTIKITNVLFRNNRSRGIACLEIFATSVYGKYIKVNRTQFIENYSSGVAMVLIRGDATVSPEFNDILFQNNRIGMSNLHTGRYATSFYSLGYTDGKVLFNRVSVKNDNGGLMSLAFRNAVINNCKILGTDSIAIFCLAGITVLNNTVVANNMLGVYAISGARVTVSNSVIAYNGSKVPVNSQISVTGGLFMTSSSSPTQYSLINSIVQKNVYLDRMANLLGSAGGGTIPNLKNSFVEGGKDSSVYLFAAKSISFTNYSNVRVDTVHFVKNPSGAGPQFYDSLSDFHVVNTCVNVSPTEDAGLNSIVDGSTVVDPGAKDLEGDIRKVNGILDIGPYEIQEPVVPKVVAEPRDSSICANGSHVNGYFSFQAISANKVYKWEESVDGSSWQLVSGQTNSSISGHPTPGSNIYYRAIISNTACNTHVTSKMVLLTVNSIPKPMLGNDTTLEYNQTLTLQPGIYIKYNWSDGGANSYLLIGKTNLVVGVNDIWVKVTDSKGCQAADSIAVLFKALDGVRKSNEIGWRVYPIPASEYIMLEIPRNQHYRYFLQNLTGRVILSGESKESIKLNLGDIPRGNYLLRIQLGSDNIIFKVIK